VDFEKEAGPTLSSIAVTVFAEPGMRGGFAGATRPAGRDDDRLMLPSLCHDTVSPRAGEMPPRPPELHLHTKGDWR
jgi:hypothetical protein